MNGRSPRSTIWKRSGELIERLVYSDSFDIDLGDVSELDYYTGLIFKVFIQGAGARVGRGGRYDRLIGNFGGRRAGDRFHS